MIGHGLQVKDMHMAALHHGSPSAVSTDCQVGHAIQLLSRCLLCLIHSKAVTSQLQRIYSIVELVNHLQTIRNLVQAAVTLAAPQVSRQGQSR